VLSGRDIPLLIPDAAGRAAALQKWGRVDKVILLPFDRRVAELPYEEFVKRVLIGECGARHLVMGQNYTCGAGAGGVPEKIVTLCRTLGVGTDVVPSVFVDGKVVSSTRIRALLSQGDWAEAEKLLGYPVGELGFWNDCTNEEGSR